MRLRDGLTAMHGPGPGRPSGWRWFPWAVAASMAVVAAVNVAMVCFAMGTFPGQAGADGFDLSNHYDRVLATVQQQAALGWELRATVDDAGRPVLTLHDRDGAPLGNARVEAMAERPLGPPETTRLVFYDDGAGRYVADAALTAAGQWELRVSVVAQGQSVATTRRVVLSKPLPWQRGRAAKRIDAARSDG